MHKQLTKKRFSLRKKLLLIFGALIFVALMIETVLGITVARKAVTEKIQDHLIDKATDVAEIIDGRIQATLQFVEGVARMPALRDSSLSYYEKAQMLAHEAGNNTRVEYFGVTDMKGNRYGNNGGTPVYVGDRAWFLSAKLQRIETAAFFYGAVCLSDYGSDLGAICYARCSGDGRANGIDSLYISACCF